MRKIHIILGTLLLLFPLSTRAAELPLYELMRTAAQRDLLLNDKLLEEVKEPLRTFVAKIRSTKTRTLTGEKVDEALRKNYLRFCVFDPPIDPGKCTTLAEAIQDSAFAEAQLRALGQDLQIIASGYEMPVDGYPERSMNLPTRYTSLVALWRSGTEGTILAQTELPLRFKTMPDNLDGPITALAGTLNGLKKPDEFTAAVWRYQHGYRFIRGERLAEFPPPPTPDSESGPGTERQYIFKRWENVETALEAIRVALLTVPLDPPLRKKEIVYFRVPKKYLDLLPENVIVWAYHENVGGDVGISGDVGLQWKIPIEPIFPSLISDPEGACPGATPGDQDQDCPGIDGGRYPPPPEKLEDGVLVPKDGVGLCTHPFARLGYLCAPITAPPGEKCIVEAEPEDGAIILTRCQIEPEGSETSAGPDVCQDIGYRLEPVGVPPIPEEENPDYICTPNRETWYLNSIGNHLCYMGQCIEQSMEGHRLLSGRSPFSVQDEAFPWDSCEARDPQFANFLTPPPGNTVTSFPAYRPGWLIQTLDTAFCQLNGLPPQALPTLCGFQATRRLTLPLVTHLNTAFSLLSQSEEIASPTQGFERIVGGIGARIGTDLYTRYLRRTGRPFGEITTMAAEVLENLTKITFPLDMCQRNAAESDKEEEEEEEAAEEKNALKDHERCLPPSSSSSASPPLP